jgi:hypothetical protein
MRGLFLSLSHRCLIALVGLLLLSTHLLWAQKTSPPSKIAIQLLDTPAPFARLSEAPTRRHFTYRELPLTFVQKPSQTESRMRLFPHSPDQYRLPTNTGAALYPAPRTAELWRKKYFISSATSTWLTFVPSYGTVPHETTYSVENLEHLANNIPWVGPIVLRIGQQAKAHPQVTRLLKVIKPRF